MKRTELESYVKQSCNMTLKDFMKRRVKGDGFVDREIADVLDLSIPTVRMLRKRYGLKRADPFFKQFENSYGPGAVERFKNIIEDPSASLADVGRQFGFSRENAHRVYKKIYGFPYTETYRKKIFLRRSKAASIKLSSNRFTDFTMVKNKLTSMGLDPTVAIEMNPPLLVTNNNLRVAVLRNMKLRQIGNQRYFQVGPINKQRQDCDFFILSYLYNGSSRNCYIIPHEYMPKKGALIPVSPHRSNSKYLRFKNEWHLLVTR